MPRALVLGASRGLGLSLTKSLAASDKNYTVYATVRSESAPSPSPFPDNVKLITGVDLLHPDTAAVNLVRGLTSDDKPPPIIDMLFVVAGVFTTDTLQEPEWEAQVKMYTISSVAPTVIISALLKSNLLRTRSRLGENIGKILLIGSEAGSVTLRHATEGGGNFGHHGSKSALNMVGKLLSLDLEKERVAVGVIHPGFMRTEMTKGVGFDEYWDSGHAVSPDDAAGSLVVFAEGFGMEDTGGFWAPRGAVDIGTAEAALGVNAKELPVPFRIPW